MPISNRKEEIDIRILRLIGLDDVFDLDYDTYLTLLKEAMVKGRMPKSSIPTEEVELLADEYKRVKNKKDDGRFEVKKKKKISSGSFSVGSIKGKIGGAKATKSLPGTAAISASPLSKSLESNISAIASAVVSISETLKQQKKVSDDASAYDRRKAEQEKRGLVESKLEKRFEGLKKAAEKIIAPVKSLLDKIIEFFTTVILGRIVYKLVEWLGDPKNANKVKSIIRFLGDWGPALLGGFILFGTKFGKGVRVLTRIALSGIARLAKAVPTLLRFAKSNPRTAAALAVGTYATTQLAQRAFSGEEKKVEQRAGGGVISVPRFSGGGSGIAGGFRNFFSGLVTGEKGVDKIPAWVSDGEFVMSRGAVAKYGVDTLEAMNAAGGGTNKPTFRNESVYAAGGGMIGETPKEIKLRNNYEYRFGKDFASKLTNDQLREISNYYNSLSDTKASAIDSRRMMGYGDELKDMAEQMIKGNTPQSFTQSSRVASGLTELEGELRSQERISRVLRHDTPRISRSKPRITRIDPSRMLPAAGESSANAMRAAERATRLIRQPIPASRAIVPYGGGGLARTGVTGGLSELPMQQIYTNMNVPGGARRAALMRLLNNPATRLAGRASAVLNAPVIGDMILPEGTSEYDQRSSAYSDPRLSPYQRRVMMESVGLRGGAIKGGYGLKDQSFKDAPKTQIMSDDRGRPFVGYKALRNGKLTYIRGPQQAGAGTSNFWENLGRMINPGAYKDIDAENARKKYDEAARGSISSLRARGASQATIAKRQTQLNRIRPVNPPTKPKPRVVVAGGGMNGRRGSGSNPSTSRPPSFSASTKGMRSKIETLGMMR